jgi:hypothetical protein
MIVGGGVRIEETIPAVTERLLNVYTVVVKKRFPKRWQIFVRRSPVAYAISNVVTVQYVVFGFLLFGSDVGRLREFFAVLAQA